MAIVYSGDNITFGDGSIIAGVATQNNVYNVVTANANTSTGNTSVTFTSNTAAINAGMIIYGAGFAYGTKVSSVVNANTILLTTAAANNATNTRISFVEPNRVVTADVAGPGLCKAWVNFNGAATTTATLIRAAFNVSSIQDNGTGDFTINFTQAMPDASYCWSFGGDQSGARLNTWGTAKTNSAVPTASALRVQFYDDTSSAVDAAYACVKIFR